MFNRSEKAAEGELRDRVVHLSRVAKVVKGGRRFSFSAIVVVGDGNGRVGYGLGKANEVPEAIRKGVERAKTSMVEIPIIKGTIPHEILGKVRSGESSAKTCRIRNGSHRGRARASRHRSSRYQRHFDKMHWN